MAEDLPIRGTILIPGSDLSWSAVRSSGPGGQNVNKVSSKVDLRFDLEGTFALTSAVKSRLRMLAKGNLDGEGRIQIVSDKTRDQRRNLDDVRERLRSMVLRALVVPKRRKPTRPSRRAKERRLKAKRQTSEKKRNRRSPQDW
ncbi:MAG: alternative ribosome rescue aminoacyl-tRNA hydrolase ArfB [Myxococcota bacterium]